MLEDVRADVNPATGQANVRTCHSTLKQVGKFAQSCDYFSGSFGKFHYAIDASAKVLHLYKGSEQEWEASSLTTLAVTEE